MSRLRYLIPAYRRRCEREVEEELAALREIAPPGELGNVTIAAENARSVLFIPLLESIAADFRYSLRALRRDRAFTAVTVFSLTVGIACNVAVFGIMNALLWRDLPLRKPEELVSFENASRSYFGYSEFAKHSAAALQSVIAQSSPMETLTDLGSGRGKAGVEFVSGNYFQALGVNPMVGRTILPSDDQLGAPGRVAVLRDSYWRSMFNGDQFAIGRSIQIGRARFQIVGVTTPEFLGLTVGEAPDIWIPVTAYPAVYSGQNWLSGRNTNWLDIFGRLRPGITIPRATALLTPVSLEIDVERNGLHPSPRERAKMLQDPIRLVAAVKGISYLRARYSQPLHVVLGMLLVGLGLICANVLSLQIARADERQKEVAIRSAIGGSRARILRQHLVEALIFSGASAVLGSALFGPLTRAITSVMTSWSGEAAQFNLSVDPQLVSIVCCLSIAIALITGFVPAFYAGDSDVQRKLQRRSNAVSHTRRKLTVQVIGSVQVAVSLVMITSAYLFALSLHELRQFDGGMNRNRLVQLDLEDSENSASPARAVMRDERLRARLKYVPGIEEVTFSQNGIFSVRNYSGRFEADGYHPLDDESQYGLYDYVGPRFFTTLGTRILEGRDFAEADNRSGSKVVIVNQTFATRVFPGQDALGKQLYMSDMNQNREVYRIIGVVRDIRTDLRRSEMTWYFPALQHATHAFGSSFLLRTKIPAEAALPSIRSALRSTDGQLRISSLETADHLLDERLDTDRLLARIGLGFGLFAIILASAGIYGLLSYDVTKRTAEFGIRSALGALKGDIVRLVLARVAVLLAVGIAVGIAAAFMLANTVQALVFGLSASDFRLELAAAGTLAGVAALAALIPAARAASIDPMNALRAE